MPGSGKNKDKQSTNGQNKDGVGKTNTIPPQQQNGQQQGQTLRQQVGNSQPVGNSGYLITDLQGNVSSYTNFPPQQSMYQTMPHTQGPFHETCINNSNPMFSMNGIHNASSFMQAQGNPIVNQTGERSTHMNLQHNGHGSVNSGQWQSSNNSLTNQAITFDSMQDMIQKMSNTFLSKLETIESKISKLDSIEREISLTRYDVSDLKRESSELRRKVEEVEVSCGTVSSLFDDYKTATDENKQELSKLKSENINLKQNCENLKEELLELKARSMQENLLFFGLSESPRGVPDGTENKLRDFLKHELDGIDTGRIDSIIFDRVHRLGRLKHDPQNNPRPIVAKFEKYTDREYIRKAGIDLNKRRNGYSIREQFPPEIEERRKLLYPVMRRYMENDENKVYLVRDKLYINGQLYDPNADQQYEHSGARPKQFASRPNNDRRQQNTRSSGYAAAASSRRDPVFERSAAFGGLRNNSFINREREQTRISGFMDSNPFSPLQSLQDTELIITPMKVGPGKKKATSPLIEELEPKKIRDADASGASACDVTQQTSADNTQIDDQLTIMDNTVSSEPLTRLDGETTHVQHSGTVSANNDSDIGIVTS